MKNFKLISLIAMTLLVFAATLPAELNAQTFYGTNFVDENGDGYNDNAPDADGDGIPNYADEDYTCTGVGGGRMSFFKMNQVKSQKGDMKQIQIQSLECTPLSK